VTSVSLAITGASNSAKLHRDSPERRATNIEQLGVPSEVDRRTNTNGRRNAVQTKAARQIGETINQQPTGAKQ